MALNVAAMKHINIDEECKIRAEQILFEGLFLVSDDEEAMFIFHNDEVHTVSKNGSWRTCVAASHDVDCVDMIVAQKYQCASELPIRETCETPTNTEHPPHVSLHSG